MDLHNVTNPAPSAPFDWNHLQQTSMLCSFWIQAILTNWWVPSPLNYVNVLQPSVPGVVLEPCKACFIESQFLLSFHLGFISQFHQSRLKFFQPLTSVGDLPWFHEFFYVVRDSVHLGVDLVSYPVGIIQDNLLSDSITFVLWLQPGAVPGRISSPQASASHQ